MKHKSECCGCTACQQVCPAQCITMEPDEEGFLYPKINEANCIHCQKCERVCPIRHPALPVGKTEAFVGYAENLALRRASSSGGVFSLAAQWILSRQGAVFGAAFDEHFQVRHICVESAEELGRLRGSKYVQSSLENTYAEAKRELQNGRWVLFSGTACQVAGLKNDLGEEYERLLTVDVLCHGVPSPKIWDLYLQEQESANRSKISSVQFRDKVSGWKQYSLTSRYENGRTCSFRFPEDPYMCMFLGNIDLRPSCYDCRFKAFPRASDLTIGDCWGIDKLMPDMDDDQGTSVILVHTPKGRQLLDAIRDKLVLRNAELDQVLPPSAESRRSVEMHPNRKKYWEGVERGENMDVLCGYLRKSLVQRAMSFGKYVITRYIYLMEH